ncbi:MAG: serine/threonine-protein kinase [Gemmataceae bacterium]
MKARRAHPSWEEWATFDLGRASDDAWSVMAEHLETCESCNSLIDTVPRDHFVRGLSARPVAGGTATGAADDSLVDAGAGDVPAALRGHPRYRVLEPLGAGGMGAVFKAEHILLGRLVALKVLHPNQRGRKAAVERLAREVKALARLSHPNLVAALDAEQSGDALFVVMEYVEGETLDRIIRRSRTLPFTLACDWIGQATLGLQYAFEHGLVHRDLKPSNLLVTPQGQVKIVDFGLARLIDEDNAGSAQTPDDAIVGTPAYTAPEQARTPKAADIRADLYSLGCTWYEMLTGQPPFSGATALEQLLAHQDQSPRPVTQWRSDVPTAVDAVFARLLAKDPSGRFGTPEEFLQTLRGLEETSPRPSPARNSSRRPLLVMAGLALVVLILLGAWLWLWDPDTRESPPVVDSEGPSKGARPTGEKGSEIGAKISREGEKAAPDSLGMFNGVWVGDVATGFHVVMEISTNNDRVEVAAAYFNKKGNFAGNFVALDAALKDGVLTFTQTFVKKPVSTWRSGKFHTLTLVDDNVLKFRWKGGGTEVFKRIPN